MEIKTPAKLIILFSIIIILAIGSALYFSHYYKQKVEEEELERYFPSIKIMVQNGCGYAGVANNVRRFLHDKNVDVVRVSNAQRFIYDETIIVVKHNDDEELKRLQKITGINNVIYAVNEQYFVPYIIIAGRDYQKYF
jgi:glutamate dehydrogenase/leucine dehydrogenase